MEKVARLHAILEAIDCLAVALAIGIVHRRQDVWRPRELELDDGHRQPRIALEHAREDHVAHRERRIERLRRAATRIAQRLVARAADLPLAPGGRVQAQRHPEGLGGGPEWLVLWLVVAPVL